MVYNLLYTLAILPLLCERSLFVKFSGCEEPPTVPNSTNNITNINENPTKKHEDLSRDLKDSENDKQPTTRDLSREAYNLGEDVKSIANGKDDIERIESTGEDIKRKLNDSNTIKLRELVNKRNQLLIKISSLGKTLRTEHDAIYPDLRGEPIIIVAKNEDDEKRKANQLAHLDGFEDFVHKISSPCSIMESIREKSLDSAELNARDRFKMEQKTLDSMNARDRLNYDNNMIEHYESLMEELTEGIHKVNDEIERSWHHYIT